jgi:hypothetical protein
MSHVTTLDQSDQPEDNVPVRLLPPIPRADQVTAIQIGTLLHATAMLSSLLTRNADEDDDSGSVTPKKTEVSIAAENTVIKILDRLDSIITDGPRWTLVGQRTLESELSAVYKAHLALLAEQRTGVEKVNAPHRHAGIKLARVDGGLWAAIIGNPGTGDCIVGIGDCPAEACEDFDRQFLGKEKNEQTEPELPVDADTNQSPTQQPIEGGGLGADRPNPRQNDQGVLPEI